MSQLLLLACSRRKLSDQDVLPAIERYNGPTFQVVRRFLRQHPAAPLDIWILSARYGLIAHNQTIPNYDQKMTVRQSEYLRPFVRERLTQLLTIKPYDEVCVCMGKTYLTTLGKYDHFLPEHSTYVHIQGTIGKMLADLHNWLYKEVDRHHTTVQRVSPEPAPTRIRGIEISLTTEQVFERARQALAAGRGDPRRYQAWYVDLDGQRVSVKWLVSQAFELPVSGFTTSDARRVLAQIGIEVYRQ